MKQIISNEALKKLCNNNGWFTEGTDAQYEKLFYANHNGCSLEDLVTIIWLCSDTKLHSRTDIKDVIKSECDIDVLSNVAQLIEFSKRKLPADWNTRSIEERRQYWITTILMGDDETSTLIDRERISAVEIWCELFGADKECIRHSDAMTINAVIAKQGDWGNATEPMRFGPYGVQRGFKKKQ